MAFLSPSSALNCDNTLIQSDFIQSVELQLHHVSSSFLYCAAGSLHSVHSWSCACWGTVCVYIQLCIMLMIVSIYDVYVELDVFASGFVVEVNMYSHLNAYTTECMCVIAKIVPPRLWHLFVLTEPFSRLEDDFNCLSDINFHDLYFFGIWTWLSFLYVKSLHASCCLHIRALMRGLLGMKHMHTRISLRVIAQLGAKQREFNYLAIFRSGKSTFEKVSRDKHTWASWILQVEYDSILNWFKGNCSHSGALSCTQIPQPPYQLLHTYTQRIYPLDA